MAFDDLITFTCGIKEPLSLGEGGSGSEYTLKSVSLQRWELVVIHTSLKTSLTIHEVILKNLLASLVAEEGQRRVNIFDPNTDIKTR